MPLSTKVLKLLDKLDPEVKEALIAFFEEMEERIDKGVSRVDFLELKSVVERLSHIVKELAEAQRRTEERVEELAEAQRRTEERVEELAEAQRRTEERVEELAEAQRRTEERVSNLEVKMAELAEAQRRTEKRVEELAEAQRRTEKRVEELAEAQKKTEQEIKKLAEEHRKTRESLGGLQHTVGHVLEDRAFVGLPSLLKKDLGISVHGSLKRDYVEIGRGNYVEINIIGKGKKNGKNVWILGEAKSQLKKSDVDEFMKKVKRVSSFLEGDKVLLFVTYQAPPPVREYVKEKGIHLYFSYQFPL